MDESVRVDPIFKSNMDLHAMTWEKYLVDFDRGFILGLLYCSKSHKFRIPKPNALEESTFFSFFFSSVWPFLIFIENKFFFIVFVFCFLFFTLSKWNCWGQITLRFIVAAIRENWEPYPAVQAYLYLWGLFKKDKKVLISFKNPISF